MIARLISRLARCSSSCTVCGGGLTFSSSSVWVLCAVQTVFSVIWNDAFTSPPMFTLSSPSNPLVRLYAAASSCFGRALCSSSADALVAFMYSVPLLPGKRVRGREGVEEEGALLAHIVSREWVSEWNYGRLNYLAHQTAVINTDRGTLAELWQGNDKVFQRK